MYVIFGIGIIISLECFGIDENIIDKAEKTMRAYKLDEFKQLFRKIYKQQHIKDAKFYLLIYMGIMGVLTYIHFTYYPDDTWFIHILALTVFLTLYSTIACIFPNIFFNEFFGTIEEEIEIKINKDEYFIN